MKTLTRTQRIQFNEKRALIDWTVLADGYSLGLYYKDATWNLIGSWLQTNYSDFAVEMILRSKIMRWVSDSSGKETVGFPTFKKFFIKEYESLVLDMWIGECHMPIDKLYRVI